jgi:glutaredoxin-like protein NrdH
MENSDAATFTVYSKPACVQCTATERWLKTKGVKYDKIDVTEDVEAYQRVTNMGYQQVPVVVTSSGAHWSGFDPDQLALHS